MRELTGGRWGPLADLRNGRPRPAGPCTVRRMTSPYEQATAAAAALAERTGVASHDVAVVLGSGWRPAADHFGSVVAEVQTTDLPGFPAATVAGHSAAVRSIVAPGGRRVLAFLGRVHAYEGHEPEVVVHGVRTACAAGCRVVVLTNAAGGIRAGPVGGPAGADRRPPQPHGPLADGRASRRPRRWAPGSST